MIYNSVWLGLNRIQNKDFFLYVYCECVKDKYNDINMYIISIFFMEFNDLQSVWLGLNRIQRQDYFLYVYGDKVYYVLKYMKVSISTLIFIYGFQ
jgi:hypothetical protein